MAKLISDERTLAQKDENTVLATRHTVEEYENEEFLRSVFSIENQIERLTEQLAENKNILKDFTAGNLKVKVEKNVEEFKAKMRAERDKNVEEAKNRSDKA